MKKEVFLHLHNVSTFVGVDLSIVEELFSLLLKCEKENCATIPLQNVLYCFVRSKHVSQINVLCTIYEKGNLTQSNQNLCDLNFPIM